MSLSTNENMLQERHLMAEDGSSKIQRKKKRQRAVESGMKKFCGKFHSISGCSTIYIVEIFSIEFLKTGIFK